MAKVYIRRKEPGKGWRYKAIPRVRVVVLRSSRVRNSTFVTRMPRASSYGAKHTTRFEEAQKEAAGLELNAKAVAIGLTVEEYKDKTNAGRVPSRRPSRSFIDDARKTKKKKTVVGYEHNLKQFQDSLDKKIRFIDEVTKKTLVRIPRFPRRQGIRSPDAAQPLDDRALALEEEQNQDRFLAQRRSARV